MAEPGSHIPSCSVEVSLRKFTNWFDGMLVKLRSRSNAIKLRITSAQNHMCIYLCIVTKKIRKRMTFPLFFVRATLRCHPLADLFSYLLLG